MNRGLLGLAVVFCLVLGCRGEPTPPPTPEPTAPPAATSTPTLAPTATTPPTATATPTPIPTATWTPSPVATATSTPTTAELDKEHASLYLLFVLIQGNAEALHEVARARAAGEIDSFQAGMLRLVIIQLIDTADKAIVKTTPPKGLDHAWELAVATHEDTKAIIKQWFNQEIVSGQVAEELGPVLDRAEDAARSAEQWMVRAFDVTAVELRTMREDYLNDIREILSATPTP